MVRKLVDFEEHRSQSADGLELVRQGRTRLLPSRFHGSTGVGFRVVVSDPSGPETVVTLDPELNGGLTTCRCEPDPMGLCAHLWAAFFTVVDQTTGSSGPPTRSALDTIFDYGAKLASGELDTAEITRRTAWMRRLNAISRRVAPLPSPFEDSHTGEVAYAYLLDRSQTRANGGLWLQLVARKRRRQGKLGRPRSACISEEAFESLTRPIDRQIWSILDPETCKGSWWSRRSTGPYEIGPSLVDVVLPLLVQSEAFYNEDEIQRESPRPYRIESESPLEFKVAVREDRPGERWVLDGRLLYRGTEISLNQDSLLLEGGWLLHENLILRVEDPNIAPWVENLTRHGSIAIPKEDGVPLLETMHSLPIPAVDWPPELRMDERSPEPKPRIRFSVAEGDPRKHPRLRASLSFDYDGEVIARADPRRRVVHASESAVIVRDMKREAEHREELFALGLDEPPTYLRGSAYAQADFQLPPSRLTPVVQTLTARGWHVEADDKIFRQATAFRFGVSSGTDWLDLEGEVQFGDEVVPLPKLLRALRQGQKTVVLGDGNHGVLPEAWLRRHGLLLSTGEIEDDKIRFRRSQTFLLDALIASEPESRWDSSFEEARARLRNAASIVPIEPGSSFHGELRPYQKEGLGWFEHLRSIGFGGCLADDMGLGKTVQVLALLDRRKSENDENDGAARSNGSPRRRKARRRSRASLIVVPRSLVSNWRAEVERFAPELRVLDHSTPFREKSTEPFANHDIVLTTYGILIRDIEYLKDWSFDYVILDEAQAIKNAESNASKASRLLRANHRLALSGTPIENHLGELWSLFEFLNPGMLGASSTFDRAIREAQAERSESAQLLGNALRPLILRRTKQEVAKELPERVEQTILCDLGREERRHYDEIRDYYRKSLGAAIEERGLGRAKIQILEALLRLRQTACHPGLIDPKRRDRPSSKVSLLLDKLRDVVDEGHKALVFSQFTKLLAIVRDRLAEEGIVYEYLDGRTRNRGEKVERFQSDPDCKVFLISLKAGGLGLNLTAAEYVFLLDPWWNPAVEAQAIDRAHRIGQTRNVVAYRIVARDTVEERVVELQERKRRLVEQIITADNGLVRSLAPEDLDVLLS